MTNARMLLSVIDRCSKELFNIEVVDVGLKECKDKLE